MTTEMEKSKGEKKTKRKERETGSRGALDVFRKNRFIEEPLNNDERLGKM